MCAFSRIFDANWNYDQVNLFFLWEDPMAHVTSRTGFSATIQNFPMFQTLVLCFLGEPTPLRHFVCECVGAWGKALGGGLVLF